MNNNLTSNNQINYIESRNIIFEKLYRQEMYNTFEKLYNSGLEFYSFKFMLTSFVGLGLEETEIKKKIKNIAWESINKEVDSYAKNWIIKIPFVVFSYIAVETHEDDGESKGFPYFHGIFAINPIIPNNGYKSFLNIKTALRSIFNEDTDTDILVNYLSHWKDVYQSMNDVIKFLDLSKHFFYFYKNQALIIKFAKPLSDFLDFLSYHRLQMGEFWDTFHEPKSLFKYTFNKLEFIEIKNNLFFDNFINTRNLNEDVIIRLLHIYMQIENLFLFNNNFYKKIFNTISSFKFFKTLDELLNSFEIVINRLLEEQDIRFYLEYTDFFNILLKYIEASKDKILKNPNLFLPNILIDSNICEFKDGFYFIQFDYFLYFKFPKHKKIIDELNSKQLLNTSRYYNTTFFNLREPPMFLESLRNTLSLKDADFLNFFKKLGMLMYPKNFENYKNKNGFTVITVLDFFLFIYFKLNLGLSDIKDNNLYIEEVIKQMFFMCDRFIYKKSRPLELVKFVKKSSNFIHLRNSNFLILRNLFSDKVLSNSEINEILEARLRIFFFRNVVAESSFHFFKQVNREIPEILVYCNKLYVKSVRPKRITLRTFYKHFSLVVTQKSSRDKLLLFNNKTT
jgi:hypothetical protein